jgi:hypothetical protein
MIPTSGLLEGGVQIALGLAMPAVVVETMHFAALDASDTYVEINRGLPAVHASTWNRVGTADAVGTSAAAGLVEDPAARSVMIGQSSVYAGGAADHGVNDPLAAARLFRNEEAGTTRQHGWLQLHGRSIRPLACDGP